MGSGGSVHIRKPDLDLLRHEAAKDPDDLSAFTSEESLRKEVTRLRKLLNSQLSGYLSEENHGVSLEEEIKALMKRAAHVEEWLTPILKKVAASIEDCRLIGLQFKFKTYRSLKRKIEADLKARERQASRSKKAAENRDIASVVRSTSDALRYTLLIPSSKYALTVVEIRQILQNKGFEGEHFKNYWCEGDMYQGINDVFLEKESGLRVEVQYHTPESWELKGEAHIIYEKFRICSEPLEQQRLFEKGVHLAATIAIPDGALDLPYLTKKSAPELLGAYATQIVAASNCVQKDVVDWCWQACPLAKGITVNVDNEEIIALELSSLMSLLGTNITKAIQSYYDGFLVSIICDPENYAKQVDSLCSKFKEGKQFLSCNGDEREICLVEARNSYDKVKHKNDDVEAVRLHMVIGSRKTESVYDNIRFHVIFFTPDSLEAQRKTTVLSQILVTNPSITRVKDEIHELWAACPDPPGASDIPILNSFPDVSNL